LRATARQHVQRRDDLGQQSAIAIHHPGDEHGHPYPLGQGSHIPQGGVGLEHRFPGAGPLLDLEVVVHHAEFSKTGLSAVFAAIAIVSAIR
jgi:hypothetical protein